MLGLTKNVAAELGKHGLRVDYVSPNAAPTSLSMPHLPENERQEDEPKAFVSFVGSHANMKGVDLTADDVARAVIYLAIDEARYISGFNLMFDGGFTFVSHSLKVFD